LNALLFVVLIRGTVPRKRDCFQRTASSPPCCSYNTRKFGINSQKIYICY